MKLSGKFFKRSMTQVNVEVSTEAIGLVWIDKDKTSGVDWGAMTQGDRVVFDVPDDLYRELTGKTEEQMELFDEESELQNDNEE